MHHTDSRTHKNRTATPSKDKLVEMLLDKILAHKTIAMECIKYMSEDEVKDMMETAGWLNYEEYEII